MVFPPLLRWFAVFCGIVFCGKIVKNITDWAKRGKMRRIEAVKRSKNVVKGGVFYYSGYSIIKRLICDIKYEKFS